MSVKEESILAKQFSREIDDKIIKSLMATDLWTKKLSTDCSNGEVFFAIRDNYISFYYKGGNLFTFRNKGFSTHVKHAGVINGLSKGEISENDLSSAKLIDNFLSGYDRIKENCEKYSLKEAQRVSCLYHKNPYTSDKKKVVVLDIEITAPVDSDNQMDILLFNKELKELRFIEAKLYDNDEIKSKTKPKVIEQMERYQDMINRRKDFLPAYQKCTNTLNKIFNLNLPEPLKIDDKLGLLILDFDDDQKKGGLEKITKNLDAYNISYYSKGDNEIDAETLWKKTN
jgi:hypothetical protein